jgi:hypothetical protein
MDFDKVVDGVLQRLSKRRVNIDSHNVIVSLVAERMIDELFKVDTSFFKEYRYDDSTQQMRATRENIDKLL